VNAVFFPEFVSIKPTQWICY